ncbi:hypothetical protein CFC21_088164 [Triticum aestivum]|uniref:Cyclin N-terminal domain-containing protein n=2 Tax=Triticum aestivum TaxID=4565 RepID=A0A3B6PL72_WHEAT|nr:uncharacterized protein LOC123137193 [Triticum aestivum]KAF7084579.1 hypothetical protein CFC21_088164 [Triticum aestivum]
MGGYASTCDPEHGCGRRRRFASLSGCPGDRVVGFGGRDRFTETTRTNEGRENEGRSKLQQSAAFKVEQSRRPRDDYIGIVVDWLMDVVDEFKLLADTLYLRIHTLANSSQRDKLSLLVSLHYLLLS